MICILFLTHHFSEEFLKTLTCIDEDPTAANFDIIVLFDSEKTYDETAIDSRFKHVRIVKTDRIKTTYNDLGGHSMYIQHFKEHYDTLQNYEYIWIVENDVYYPDSFIQFFDLYKTHHYDLLVSNYGTRDVNWYWRNAVWGQFREKHNVGVYAFIMRMSQRMLRTLIDTIDTQYFGYLEIVLPHICLEREFSIQTFIPDTCGILTTEPDAPLVQLIRRDIQTKTYQYIEKKIYHPVKL
jgi:hypothetical protein